MENNELLAAISNMMDEKIKENQKEMKVILKPIKDKLEGLDIKIDTLQLNQKTGERAIRKDINFLNDEVDTLIAVMEARGILQKVE